MLDLHFICPHGARFKNLGDMVFESGNWTVKDERANKAIGGRFYLHEQQKKPAWHGGTIQSWRPSADDPSKKVFVYKVDGDFRVLCTGKWGQEQATVER